MPTNEYITHVQSVLLDALLQDPFFVAFSWEVTSTGPGEFMICVFII